LPNIYKASSVTLTDNAVPIELGELLEMSGAAPKIPVTLNSTIKNEHGRVPGKGKNPESFIEEARDEAELIILKARGEAQLITENAKSEMERLRVETEKNAHDQGYQEGFQKGASESETLKREAEEIVRGAQTVRDEMLRDVEPDVIELIVKILHKLLGVSVRFNPQIILKLIREGLAGVVGSEGVKLRVSPDDYGYVKEHFDKIMEYAGSNNMDLIKDAACKPMDCVIETAYGNIDSSLDQQFESLRADLLYILNNAEA